MKTINLIAIVQFFSVLLNCLWVFSLSQLLPFFGMLSSMSTDTRFKKYLSEEVCFCFFLTMFLKRVSHIQHLTDHCAIYPQLIRQILAGKTKQKIV